MVEYLSVWFGETSVSFLIARATPTVAAETIFRQKGVDRLWMEHEDAVEVTIRCLDSEYSERQDGKSKSSEE